MFVANFEAIGNVASVLGLKNRPQFGVKSGLIKKRLKCGKKYFTVICLMIPFHPNQPTFGPPWGLTLFFPFFPFFSSQILYALLLLNHKTSKSNFCVKLFSCKRKFISRNFLGRLPQELPQNGAPKINFFNGLSYGASFFWYQEIFKRQIFWHSLGVPSPGVPPKWIPKNQLLERLKLACQFFFVINRYVTNKYIDIVRGCLLPGDPPKWHPPKSIFEWLNFGCQWFLITVDSLQTNILT